MNEPTVTMSAAFTAVLGAVWDGIGGVVDTIKAEPLLLIPVGVAFAGACIGLAKSLMGSRRRRAR